jgi:Uma2 family endonuclease
MVMANRARARTRLDAPSRTRPWTRADLARLPDDGNRYEVLDGQLLVTPQASLPHQRVAVEFVMVLERYVRPQNAASVVGPGAVPFGDNELQPDVQVIPGPRRAGTWDDCPAPILVVEVLSRSTRGRDFGIKLAAYLDRVRVQTVWVVDHNKREVHVCERGMPPRAERQALEWHAPGAPDPLRIDLPAFFREALGE